MCRTSHICALLAMLAIVCGLSAGQSENSQPTSLDPALARAPAVAATWANPYAGQDNAARAGRKLFERHCAECHGENGQGSERAPRLARASVHDAPPGVLFWFVKNGDLKEGMPAWSRLPDQRLWQIVSYLQTMAPDKTTEKDR